MSLWGRIVAAGYDRFMAGTEKAGLADRRRELVSGARGRVLELGAGTGANLDYYTDAVTELVLTEPEQPMAKRLEKKAAASGRATTVVRAPAEQLPFPDESFDTAVCTLVLCTVRDPQRALAEIHRVLKPDGSLLFLEHVRSEDPKVAKWQDRIAPIWLRIGHGCNCNRPTPDFIRGAFERVDVRNDEMPKAPAVFRPLRIGRAASA